jgi:SAM-dependent methyltransferase
MELFVNKYLDENKELSILDLGSQDVNGTYKPLFDRPNWKYHGCDTVKGKNVDIVLDNPYDWKAIKSCSYNVLISGQAFEHIEYFWITMMEIARVLKPEGICCIIAPSGGILHSYPVDCWRFYNDGFKALSEYAKLKVLEAYTDWEPGKKYQDYSEIWKDSVLIAKKTVLPIKEKIKFHFKNYLLRLSAKL